VEHLLAQIVTGDLIALLRPELARQGEGPPEEQAPAITAAVERLADDDDVDLLTLAKDPSAVGVAELEAMLTTRAEAREASAHRKAAADLKASAEYWRHIGALRFLHDTHKALAAYEKSVALDAEAPEGWRYLGELRYRLGELTLAEDAFESLLELAKQQGDKHAESTARLRLSWIYGDRGDFAAAEEFQAEALRIAEGARWTEGMARTYANLGIICQARGDLAQAQEMQQKSLELEKELGSKEGMARAYIHHAHKDWARAEEMQQMSLRLNEELGRKEGIALAYGNLGVVYRAQGDPARAEDMQMKSLELSAELGRKEGVALAYGNLGLIYERRGDSARMCDSWRKARDFYRQIGLDANAAEWEAWMRHKGCNEA
jgi:protein O-GlcNAc transferase